MLTVVCVRLSEQAEVAMPPEQVTLLALKEEKRLEIYAADDSNGPRFVLSYPILAASGIRGPKLREGDKQVPEGFYRIELLNPNSRYHLSLRVNYPNPADIEQAGRDGRDLSMLGGDIMIHGGADVHRMYRHRRSCGGRTLCARRAHRARQSSS